MLDIALLKSRMRSRKDKQAQLEMSPNEYAFDNANKKVVDNNPKMKLVAKHSVGKV